MVMRARWEAGVVVKVRRVRRWRVLVEWERGERGRRDVRKDIFLWVEGCGVVRYVWVEVEICTCAMREWSCGFA